MRNGRRSPVPAIVAGALSVAFIVVFWSLRIGPYALVFTPLLALWVANVHLGGRLNDSPLDGVRRIRTARSESR